MDFQYCQLQNLEDRGVLKWPIIIPGIVTDPDKVNRQTIPEDRENLEYVLDKYLPGSFGSAVSFKIMFVCQ